VLFVGLALGTAANLDDVHRSAHWYALRKIRQEADAQNKGWCSSVCKKEYLARIRRRRRTGEGRAWWGT